MRSSLLILISILSNVILIAHSFVALPPFAAAAAAIRSGSSSLQQWNLNLAATDSDSSESAALEVDNGNSNADPVSWDWEQLAASAYTDDDRPIILFDGQCNLCNGGVNFALDHDPNGM